MKNPMKRGASALLALVMIVSLCSGLTLPVHAASYLYNWGHRGTTATELSDAAVAFYADNCISYEMLAAYAGDSDLASVPGSPLYAQLQALMVDNHTTITDYQETRPMYAYTDCQGGGGKISSFYSGLAIGPDWDSGATWNREHTWPNSKGLGGSDENDIMMLRPTAKSENGSRGNTAYGESSGYFDPNAASGGTYDVRGDVARIALYVYTRWGNTSYMWGSSGVMESKEVLLKWMEQDPVDTWELGRNDVVQSITGTRNVFVDYPELAFLLFGEEVPVMTTPSGKADEEILSCEHNYLHYVTEPTCTENGYSMHVCCNCGDIYMDSYVIAPGHVPDIPEPTEDQVQRCLNCLQVVDFVSIKGYAGEGISFELTRDGVLTYTGTGIITSGEDILQFYEDRIEKIVIGEGIRSIKDDVMPDMPNLTSITFPETMRWVGASAFSNCTKLESLEFPESLKAFGDYAFEGCTGLTSLSFPEGADIGLFAFAGCAGLKTVTLPVNGNVNNQAFADCYNLKSAVLHGTLGSEVFQNCTSLTEVQVGEDVPAMYSNLFGGCTSLVKIHIPGNVKSLYRTFQGCTALEEVTMDYGVTIIGEKTFSECTNLKTLTLPASVAEMGSSVFWLSKTPGGSLTSLYFTGNAPAINGSALHGLRYTTTCYYPKGNSTWTADVLKHYGSTTVKWQAYDNAHTHSYVAEVTEPNCTEDGCTTYTCTICGDSYQQDIVEAWGHSWKGEACSICGAENPNFYYGRAQLAKMANAKALLYAYDQMVAGVEAASTEIPIYNGETYLTAEEFWLVEDAYIRDYAHHFWLSNEFGYRYNSSGVISAIPHYLMTGTALETARAAFEAEVTEILSGITPSMSDYEKELYLHDTLAARIVYQEADNAHNAYGALVDGVAVCEGYAEAFQYLLQQVGIQSFLIAGTSDGENHAWNAVNIGGKWYHVDLTWDDQETDLYHAYFNLTDTRIQEDHVIFAADYGLPTCNSEDAFYFTGKDTLLDSYDVDTLADLITANGGKVHVYITGDMAEFWTWINENGSAVATEVGDGLQFGCLGHEVILAKVSFVECSHNYEPVITAPTCTEKGYTTYTCTLCDDTYTADETAATGHDYDDGVVTTAPSCTEKGVKTFTCGNCGDTYTEAVAAIGHDYESVVTAPTCTEKGYTTHTCTVCGDSYTDSETAAKGHTPNIPAATETEDQVCTTCGTVLDSKTGHICGKTHFTLVQANAATCTTAGNVEHYLCSCGKMYADLAATQELTSVVIPAKGHSPSVLAGYAATCTTDGKTEGSQCARCSTVLTAQTTIPALGHNPVTDDAVDATCTTAGKTEGSHCDRCNTVLVAQEPIDALGHTEETVPAVAPTCTSTGLTEGKKCSVCNEVLTAQTIVDALGHKEIIDEAVAATCQSTGLTEGKHCEVCHEILIAQTVVEKLPHTEEIIPAVDPTCTTTGKTEGKKCSVCGETILAQTVVDALGHTPETIPAVAPTCTATGLTEGSKCSICGTTLTAQTVVNALGHTEETIPAVAPTCTATGLTEGKKCTVCGITTVEQTGVPATGHSWNNGSCGSCGTACEHSYDENGVCTICGYGCTHDYAVTTVDPNCTEQGYTIYTCNLCGNTYNGDYVDAKGHTWQDATCVTAKTCTVCNTTEGEPNGHNYNTVVTAPTCTAQGYTTHICTACGDSYTDTYTDETGHTAGVPVEENRNEPSCTAEGSYDNVIYCSVCGEEMSRQPNTIPAKGHNYESAVTAPACTEQGYTVHTCTACGDTYTDSYTPATGHAYGEWETITAATCTEAGEKKQTCICGDVVTEEIPAKGHSWTTIDATTMECTVCGEKQSGYRVELDALAVADTDYVFVDGKKYPITKNGDEVFVNIMHTDATNLVSYTVNEPTAADPHTQYPTGMRVWMLKYENGAYTATHMPEFDNLLQYSGSSIRIVGVKGIRMITSIDKDTRAALIKDGLAGYTLVEYGTALAWASDLDEENPLVLGREYTKSNFAYKRGEADPIFNRTGNLIQYTNVLVGFTDDQCIPDIVMRSYIILEDAEGNQITLYGGEVVRNIGYIAWQNRLVFNPGNAAYDYVWNIIHHVYGDKYDEDYKG